MVRTASLALLAVALLVGSAPAAGAPTVQVYEGAALVPGTVTTPISYGIGEVARSKTRTFTLRNNGAAALSIDPLLSVPQGFTIARRPGALNLAPGESTTFAVSLNAARAGYFAGNVVVNTSAGPATFPVEGSALGSPTIRILDNTDPGFRTLGRWTAQSGQGLQGNAVAIQAGSGTNVAAWTFKGLIPGLYQVSATWSPNSRLATDARFTLVNGSKTTVVPVNQQAAPADFQDAGTAWQRLGQPFKINGNTLVVQLSDLANGGVVADAVRIERVGMGGHIATVTDPGFKATGAWTQTRGSLQALNGSASWTFNVRPGQYRVSATWSQGAQLASDAQYTVYDGDKPLATQAVNQQNPPAHFRDAGTRWQDLAPLGGLYTIQSGRLTVTLSAPSTAGPGVPPRPLSASAVRIEQMNGPSVQTAADVIRFLEQATWGPTPELAAVFGPGYSLEDYLSYQYNVPSSSYPTMPLYPQAVPNGFPQDQTRDHYSMYLPQLYFFGNGLYAEDQLKQRVAWALHSTIVAGATEQDTRQPSRMIPYLQILDRHALGRFRTLMQDITLNAAMGAYLDMKDSVRTRPNENYARELLQLFTIGLDMLNPDGTPILDGSGVPVPTYAQADVEAFTRVFTGWNLAAQVPAPPPLTGNVPNYHAPMIIANDTAARNNHDWTRKDLFFGTFIPARPNQVDQTVANANAEMNTALNNIFNHPNVGPYICKLLIQRLVTSNPSPDYVARVSFWFDYTGFGARGDLSSVVWAILMDPEARTAPVDPNYGKLREPVQLALNLLRAFNAYSRDGTWYSDGYINPQTSNLGQNVFNPPSVFSYFPYDNVLPGTTNVAAPEFGLLDTIMAIRRANFVNTMTFGGGINADTAYPFNAFYGTSLTLYTLEAMANDPGAMADYLNDLLLHGEMSANMRTALVSSIGDVPANNPTKRARQAIYLVVTSSQYQVQR